MSRTTPTSFDNWTHGTRSTYVAGCRCQACRDATAAYARARAESDLGTTFAKPEPWMDDGACVGADPEVFFIERGESAAPAKAICAGCPVRELCLEYALERGEKFGVWGGKSERERRRLRRARRVA